MTNEERRKATEWFRNRAKNCPMSGSRRMYEIATEALEERERNEQPHWIPCSERLPEEEKTVLTWGKEHKCILLDWMHDNKWCCFGDADYWMPLPEPPEKESESCEDKA